MSQIAAAQWTAAATVGLAAFAVVTAVFAFLAFRKQSREVKTLEGHASDLKELIGQQAELLKVQFGRLELQRQQFEEERAVNARQTEVLELQTRELKASLKHRHNDQ